jgi:hypothetical protein
MPSTREGRLSGGSSQTALRSKVGTEASANIVQPPPDPITVRRRWAYTLIRRCQKPPARYGSRSWLALPEADPAKVAAVVVAAEAWARMGDELEADVHREVDEARRAHKAAEDVDYQARAEAHRENHKDLPTGRSFAERRAAQLAAIEPRPGDFTGQGSA